MRRPITRALALATFVATALMGPGVQAADFELWHALGGKAGDFVAGQCRRFNDSQAAHRVACVFQGDYDQLFQKTISAYRARKQPALVQVFDAGTIDMMLSGAIVPVTDLPPPTGRTGKDDDVLPMARAFYAAPNGRLEGQPYNISTLLFYTNDTMLKAAGVTGALETWEEVAAAAARLKVAGVSCPMVLDLNPWRVLEQFSAVHGVPIASLSNGFDGLGATYLFDKGPNRRFIDDLARWHRDGLMRFADETKAGKYTPAFDSGECAMILNSSGAFADTMAAVGRRDTITARLVPVYAGTNRRNTIVGGGALFALKGFDRATQDGVAAFLAFARSPGEVLAMTAATGYLPATRTAADALLSDPGLDPAIARVALLGVKSLGLPGTPDTRGTRLGFFVRFRAIYTEEVTKVFTGQASAKEALTRARVRGDELLRRFEQTYARSADN